jgi:cytochrome b pre-mRNA-processing protein 3
MLLPPPAPAATQLFGKFIMTAGAIMLAAAGMGLIASLKRLVGGAAPSPVEPLYAAVVAEARQPHWYVEGAVSDTLDGRFDMVVLVLALLLLRLEDVTASDARHPAAQLSADLADRFLADMEGNLRQDGIGDQVIPKHMGRMMAALGGRIGAYRNARGDSDAMRKALRRNLYRGEPVADAAVSFAADAALRLWSRLSATPYDRLAAGHLEPNA